MDSSESKIPIKLNVLKDIYDNFVIEDHCYIFKVDDKYELRVPTNIIQETKNQFLFAKDGTIYYLLFSNEADENIDDSQTTTTTEPASKSKEIDTAIGQQIQQTRWTEQATRCLIHLYGTYRKSYENSKIKTFKKMWILIKDDMEKKGHKFTIFQIENKWKALERSFKNHILYKKKTGRGRKMIPFEKELEEILGTRHSVKPPYTISTNESQNQQQQTEVQANQSQILTEDIEVEQQESVGDKTIVSEHENKKDKGKTKRETLNLLIKELTTTIKERDKNKSDIEQKKYEQRQELLEELRRRNDLIEKTLLKKREDVSF